MSYFGAISLAWPFTVLAYTGTAFALAFVALWVRSWLPDRSRAHAADATAHHDFHEATHSADSIGPLFFLVLAAMRAVDAVAEWRDRRRYRNWGNK